MDTVAIDRYRNRSRYVVMNQEGTVVRKRTIRSSLKARTHALLGKCGITPLELSDLFGKTGREWLGGLALPQEYRDNLDGYLRTMDFLTEKIKLVEDWLAKRTRTDRDTRLLMQIPGVGRFGAALLRTEIGDIGFFRTKRHLSSFVGVVSGAHNSDQQIHATGLKKDSNRMEEKKK